MDDIVTQMERIATVLRALDVGGRQDPEQICTWAWILSGLTEAQQPARTIRLGDEDEFSLMWNREADDQIVRDGLNDVKWAARDLLKKIAALRAQAIDALIEEHGVDLDALSTRGQEIEVVLWSHSRELPPNQKGPAMKVPPSRERAALEVPHLSELEKHLPRLIAAADAAERKLARQHRHNRKLNEPKKSINSANASKPRKLMIARWAWHAFVNITGKTPRRTSSRRRSPFVEFLEELYDKGFTIERNEDGRSGADYMAKTVIDLMKAN